jgi:hypothetical protein
LVGGWESKIMSGAGIPKQQGKKLRLRAGAEKLVPESSKEVQYAT